MVISHEIIDRVHCIKPHDRRERGGRGYDRRERLVRLSELALPTKQSINKDRRIRLDGKRRLHLLALVLV